MAWTNYSELCFIKNIDDVTSQISNVWLMSSYKTRYTIIITKKFKKRCFVNLLDIFYYFVYISKINLIFYLFFW